MAQYAHYSDMSPDLIAAVAQLPPAQPFVDINIIRQGIDLLTIVVKKSQLPLLPADNKYRIQDHTVPVDGAQIIVRSIVPIPEPGEDGTYPLFFWVHGGGWAVGDLELDDFWLRYISVELRISVLSVEYRLAPEHPFPIPFNDCYAALKWAASNAALFDASLTKGFITGGVSAGATISASMSLREKDDPYFEHRRLTGQVLQLPCIIHPDAYPEKYKSELLSLEQNKDAPILNRDDVYKYGAILGADPSDPEVSVLLHPNHAGVCPAFLQISGQDPLRDEGILYEKVLKEKGIKTRIEVYPGFPHGGHNLFPGLPISKKWQKDFRDGLLWLLNETR